MQFVGWGLPRWLLLSRRTNAWIGLTTGRDRSGVLWKRATIGQHQRHLRASTASHHIAMTNVDVRVERRSVESAEIGC